MDKKYLDLNKIMMADEKNLDIILETMTDEYINDAIEIITKELIRKDSKSLYKNLFKMYKPTFDEERKSIEEEQRELRRRKIIV